MPISKHFARKTTTTKNPICGFTKGGVRYNTSSGAVWLDLQKNSLFRFASIWIAASVCLSSPGLCWLCYLALQEGLECKANEFISLDFSWQRPAQACCCQ